ncbi:hypothetical protein [Acetobacter fallax]|uniref:Uncharacterized protein n=1 Tax=Acetobacter fallax TaxID=1737473 RepID=A0ABX0K7Y3_9PROT|nr:hypothetical protein [Acetobacter fallax]NHO31872.1 hypothetical protein [Acetobacter fallax]NHO35365.1 hypothetical protein [Acetobacter fallax]
MVKMTPEFQARQRPAAALIVAVSIAAAGGLVTLVRKVMGARRSKAVVVPEVGAPGVAPRTGAASR